MRAQKGFTLIEVMVVVVIIAIIAAIALPNYSEHVRRGHRAEAQSFLADAAARQERYYTQNYNYADTIPKLYGGADTTRKSVNDKYSIKIEVKNGDGGYTMTATPTFTDTNCGSFSLTATGVRAVTGTKDNEYCWR